MNPKKGRKEAEIFLPDPSCAPTQIWHLIGNSYYPIRKDLINLNLGLSSVTTDSLSDLRQFINFYKFLLFRLSNDEGALDYNFQNGTLRSQVRTTIVLIKKGCTYSPY